MIIDGHAHMGGEYSDLASIIAELERERADSVVLCPAEKARSKPMPLPVLARKLPHKELSYTVNRLLRTATANSGTTRHIEQGNEEVYHVSRVSGKRVIQFYWADMRNQGLLDDLDNRLNLWNFKGIKLHQSCQPFETSSVMFGDLADYAAAKNLPVFIHLHSPAEVKDFIAAARAHSTIFIAGHLIGLEIFTDQKQGVPDNIYFDISCPQLVPPELIRKALKAFGPGRIIMGSDTPYGRNNLHRAISTVGSLGLDDDKTEMILGNNLRDILAI